MKIYLRKVFPHDVTHEVSVTTAIVSEFFENQSGMTFVGINSGSNGRVTINNATDPRFGGDFKNILVQEGNFVEDDIITIYKKGSANYAIEVVRRLDPRYETFSSLFNGNERHAIFYLDDELNQDDENRAIGGTNILFYGVPGSGKSHAVSKICSDTTRMERVVFHPEYTYSDFVGQILPRVDDDGSTIRYEFVEGPFTRILKKAEMHKGIMYYLVIEEINRGNAPAIFGDVFQLLDRDDNGNSKYGISNQDIAQKVYNDGNVSVIIPSNVTILATMNTSDQNVFTLDTAFQRRWDMKQISNKFASDHAFADMPIADTSVTWKHFNEVINDIIVRKNPMASTEDKRLGTYFIKMQDLAVGNKNFPEKVIKYLWDDAVKFSRDIIFNDKEYPTLEMVIEAFEESSQDERLRVFKSGLFDSIDKQVKEDDLNE